MPQQNGVSLVVHCSQAAFLTTVDPHKNPRLRERFGITHLPTLLLLRDRKVGGG